MGRMENCRGGVGEGCYSCLPFEYVYPDGPATSVATNILSTWATTATLTPLTRYTSDNCSGGNTVSA